VFVGRQPPPLPATVLDALERLDAARIGAHAGRIARLDSDACALNA
jgi:hypothetical protein